MYINEKGQAVAGPVVKMSKKDFVSQDQTSIYWMGSASIYIQSHGTKIMIDPLLKGFDMPLLFDMPILPQDVPSLDGVLITHIDNDHFSRITCSNLKSVCKSYHAPHYVASVMNEEAIPGVGHDIGESFKIGSIDVTLTKAVHNWQNGSKKYQYRTWLEEDYCGYSVVSNTIKNPYLETTAWGRVIDSQGLRLVLNELYDRYQVPLFIVENGLGTTDELINDTVEDDYRIDCHRKHIEQMKIAVEQDGVE